MPTQREFDQRPSNSPAWPRFSLVGLPDFLKAYLRGIADDDVAEHREWKSPALRDEFVVALLDPGLIVLLVFVELLELYRRQRPFVVRESAQLILRSISACCDKRVRVFDRRFGAGVRDVIALRGNVHVRVANATLHVPELVEC